MKSSRAGRKLGIIGGLLAGLLAGRARAVDTSDTRMLAAPAIAPGRIAFVYADDVWTADEDGAHARRLTSHPGAETNPRISPDGETIAFSASYDGNVDVYVVPAAGGEPRRLTWHPGDDLVRGFTPDGKVLFASQREVFTNRHAQLFAVAPAGGAPERLPAPSADMGALSPDGASLAYTPIAERFRQWKNYRGGTASRIWVLKLADLSHVEIPKPAGGCNDTMPMWVGPLVYFLSDRDGEFNLFSFDPATKAVARLTDHQDFPIDSASAGAGKVIYEQAGYLHVYDPAKKASTRLKVAVAADLAEARPRRASNPKLVRGADVSPSGKRLVLEYRGEIVTVPAKKGDPRNLTDTPGVHERSPIWSPDGKSIAYFSDASGEYALHVRPQDGKGEVAVYPLHGPGYYQDPVWSPDSKKIAYVDNAKALSYIDLSSSAVKKVANEPFFGLDDIPAGRWSPDSKWLAYTIDTRAGIRTIGLYSLDQDKTFPLTDGLVEAGVPAFDVGGKYLYFAASTDAGPVKNSFDQSSTDAPVSSTLYLVSLQKATPNPLLKESDEEGDEEKGKDKDKDKPKDDKEKAKKDEADKDKKDAPDAEPPKPVKPVVIDLDGISGRIIPLPAAEGLIANVAAGDEGQVYYLHRPVARPIQEGGGAKTSLRRFDLKTREEQTLAEGIADFRISADRKKILYRADDVVGVVDAGKFAKGDGAIGAVAAVSIAIDPRAEWPQMFHEAWRINRDHFYAPNMHGADWDAVRAKYEAFLPHLATRTDLNRVIRWMLSELSVGHSYLGGGERLYEPKKVPVGLLGADYQVADGRYKFKTIYGGAFWDPTLRAPLAAPGVDVKVGDYLLAVDGRDVKADAEVYKPFEGTVGRRTELKVGPKADGSESRTVVVEPIADESALRNRAWVEGNLRKVHERTQGRAAYIYVPNTAEPGFSYFKRYFFPQADKDAVIVDERFNGGGQIADYYITLLRRPLIAYWAARFGEAQRSPNATILGPKVMLIDETAGSGGDVLPWMFRKFGLGPLVGKRTWGGVVGITDMPVLMDGGGVTAPNLANFTEDGWIIENIGVPPDVDVEQDPALVAAGKDPQLDKAIEMILEALEKSPPPKRPAAPALPIRVRRPAEAK
ncbi:S41 family peptidase [Paludisphaera mucosa]|uniref:Tricorn protease homolog n=1 Tax=Paludisphaera mucosa TaxID=3030827 RepID=A0ABT6FJW0_9BACT|nr:S41 family peptidase [Paludisphaera mucosa]MDG3007868.1 PDZ domain-containing protein [Paludisphaera mucosa]